MNLKKINDKHERLLDKLGQPDFSDIQARAYRKSLGELYNQFQQQKKELEATINSYDDVAEMIRKKRPIQSGLNYIRVRKSCAALNEIA
jgi:hypothetical protein